MPEEAGEWPLLEMEKALTGTCLDSAAEAQRLVSYHVERAIVFAWQQRTRARRPRGAVGSGVSRRRGRSGARRPNQGSDNCTAALSHLDLLFCFLSTSPRGVTKRAFPIIELAALGPSGMCSAALKAPAKVSLPVDKCAVSFLLPFCVLISRVALRGRQLTWLTLTL